MRKQPKDERELQSTFHLPTYSLNKHANNNNGRKKRE